jgi:L-ascorbate metabolism protein UlaG (beta-lactamase superfamily)
MTQPGDDAQKKRDEVARFSLRSLGGRASRPVALIATLRIFWQRRSASRTRHCFPFVRCYLARWCVGVFQNFPPWLYRSNRRPFRQDWADHRQDGTETYLYVVAAVCDRRIIRLQKKRGGHKPPLQIKAVKHFLLLALLFTAHASSASLDRYARFVVADGKPSQRSATGVRITYLGTNGYQFEIEGHALLVDPYFSRVGFMATVLGQHLQPNERHIAEAINSLRPHLDAVLVTHAHIDHLFDVPHIMRLTTGRLFASKTAVELAEAAGAPGKRCESVAPGDSRRIGPWMIRAFPATHDRVFPIGVPFPGEPKSTAPPRRASDWKCGQPLSFLIEVDGKRVYIDSGGRPSLLPPADIGPVDLAILGVALPDSRARFVQAVRRLRPRYILPSHQDNFFQPLDRGFVFGPMTDFPRVLRDYERAGLSGHLILLDYFRPWTLR